jgi:hypothetical protein
LSQLLLNLFTDTGRARICPKETAMIQLTADQHQALENGSDPMRVLDPATNTEYVLIRTEVYDRFKRLLDEDDARIQYAGLADLDPEDWEDAAVYEEKP